MLIISGYELPDADFGTIRLVSISQSRCLSFQVRRIWKGWKTTVQFQSRNRDACHFRERFRPGNPLPSGFNLAIEMLVISGARGEARNEAAVVVSISQSRCLSFQVARLNRQRTACVYVSISQSRCLSFQVALPAHASGLPGCFNLAIEMLVISGGCRDRIIRDRRDGFNLAIEMLVISG